MSALKMSRSEHPVRLPSAAHRVEGIARVVAVDGQTAWLEPEQTTSCGHCASAASCGAKGIGSVASRIEKRRFPLANDDQLRVGERVVVGIGEQALVKASLTAYMIPLAVALIAGAVAESLYGSDPVSMLAMAGGLFAGLLLARISAGRLSARGELAPRFLRRARPGESCNPD